MASSITLFSLSSPQTPLCLGQVLSTHKSARDLEESNHLESRGQKGQHKASRLLSSNTSEDREEASE